MRHRHGRLAGGRDAVDVGGFEPGIGTPLSDLHRARRDRGFESISLQRRVTDEPGSARSPTEGGFPMGRQAPPQTRKGLAAPPPHIRQFTPIRPRTTCRVPASASHSIEPGAYTVLVDCGLRRCSAASACRR